MPQLVMRSRHRAVRSTRTARLDLARTSFRSGLPEPRGVKTPRKAAYIFDVGVHLLDLIQWVSGQEFVEVSAVTHPDRRLNLPDDTVTVLGRLDQRLPGGGASHAGSSTGREQFNH